MMREEYDIKTLAPRKNPYTELLHKDDPGSLADDNIAVCKENAAIHAMKELQKDLAGECGRIGPDPEEAADKIVKEIRMEGVGKDIE